MTAPVVKKLRCVIYARKSSEEGLEQDFNSLHAQREACEAYIKSQQHEGWVLDPTVYEDGGYSGGNMERPAIKRLLAEVAAGRIQIIVVYKVDRLTRSLSDFARIVELFDKHGTSFVSVTQQFNTTTSMGRLTLNVLLSFAQFEREVTGERIRDKIAMSKRKGLWMGGTVPIGYRPKDRTLEIHPEEAALVRRLYNRYLELNSITDLVRELRVAGERTPIRLNKAGKPIGGAEYFNGGLWYLLTNPVYVGKIRHRDKFFDGQHPPILSQEVFDQVQARLQTGAKRLRGQPPIENNALLRRKLFDSRGNLMSTSTPKKNGRCFAGYSSAYTAKKRGHTDVEITTIRAKVIEPLVLDALAREPDRPSIEQVQRVDITNRLVRISVQGKDGTGERLLDVKVEYRRRGQTHDLVPAGGATDTAPPEPDQALIKAIVRAFYWRSKLEANPEMTLEDLAREDTVSAAYITRLLPLAFLAPRLVEAVLNGRQPPRLSVEVLRNQAPPLTWANQSPSSDP